MTSIISNPRMSSSHRKISRRRVLLKKFGTKCHWCKIEMTPVKVKGDNNPRQTSMTIDHVLPLWNGGDNSRNNTVLACYECNQERNTRDSALVAEKFRIVSAAIGDGE